ncbi:MAG: hypothetical protein ACR2MM_09185 [Flavobacteriaceae bacterium]
MMENTDVKQKWRFTPLQILEGLEGVLIIAACYFSWFLKPLRNRWGLTREEASRVLPGDTIVEEPKSVFSHGILINAPVDHVWPWVAQMGKGRGGFYSYEALENLMGLDIYNADTILKQYQNPKKGDIIPFGPDNGYPLAICKEGESLVIENNDDLDKKQTYDPSQGHPKNFLHLSWLWHIEAIDQHRSRFISRNRVNHNNSFKNRLIFTLAEPVVFAMDRKMCLGIKRRAERHYKYSGTGTDYLADNSQKALS